MACPLVLDLIDKVSLSMNTELNLKNSQVSLTLKITIVMNIDFVADVL